MIFTGTEISVPVFFRLCEPFAIDSFPFATYNDI